MRMERQSNVEKNFSANENKGKKEQEHQEHLKIMKKFLEDNQPKELSDLLLPDYYPENIKTEFKPRIDAINFDVLKFLLLSNIRTSREDIPCPELLKKILENNEDNISAFIDGIKSVIDELGYDENRRQNLVQGLLGDFSFQREFNMHTVSELVSEKKDEDEALELFFDYLQDDFSISDADNFDYRLIENTDRLAKIFPEHKQELEDLFLYILEHLSKLLDQNFGGVFTSDAELQGDEYKDIDIYSNKYFDNIISRRVSHLLYRIESSGSHKSIDALLDFFQTKSAVFIPDIARVCNKIDPRYTVNKIRSSGLANSEDRFVRKAANAIWHRLDLGEIGIDEQVIDYLGQKFELRGELASYGETASRVTAGGDMGIFDDKGNLIGYFNLGELEDENVKKQVEILEISRQMLFADQTNLDTEQEENLKQKFLEGYNRFFKDIVFQKTGVPVNNTSLREQFWLHNFIHHEDVEGSLKDKAFDFIAKFDEPGMKAFISFESDKHAGERLISISENVSEDDMNKLLFAYRSVVLSVEKVKEQNNKNINDTDLIEKDIIEGLLVRAKDLILSVHKSLEDKNNDPKKIVDSVIKELSSETFSEKALSGRFRKLVELLSSKKDNSVELLGFVEDQEKILKTSPELLLRALHSRGELSPIPEIHWRVDRGLEEYKQRFGFDIVKLLENLKDQNKKKVLLEFGPGSGKSKEEREEEDVSESYIDVTMANKLYYPVNTFIKNCIDWDFVEAQMGDEFEGYEETRDILSDLFYKTIMIADGQIDLDNFYYDKKRISVLASDPNNLRELMKQVAPQLASIETIPTTISTRDTEGNVVYPYKVNILEKKQESEVFTKLITLFSSPENIEKCLKEGDLFEYLPANPKGIMVNDFLDTKKLQDNQIDVAMGVRSTVYKYGDEYIDFMLTMADKLADEGLYIDDNVRDNDGWYYRLAELTNLKRTLKEKKQNGDVDYDITMQLILGPGFEGEDYSNGEVPLALVARKNSADMSAVTNLLEDGYKIVSVEDYISNKEALATLDSTGYVLNTVELELSSPL